MVLSSDTLASALTDAFNPFPESLDELADSWFEAYSIYAQGATVPTGGGTATFKGPGIEANFLSNLKIAFAPSEDPSKTMPALGDAFSAFWLTSPTAIFNPSGSMNLISVIPGDINDILGLSFPVGQSQKDAISSMATAFHLFTQSIKVTGTYISGGFLVPFSQGLV